MLNVAVFGLTLFLKGLNGPDGNFTTTFFSASAFLRVLRAKKGCFEPATYGLKVRRAARLRYRPNFLDHEWTVSALAGTSSTFWSSFL